MHEAIYASDVRVGYYKQRIDGAFSRVNRYVDLESVLFALCEHLGVCITVQEKQSTEIVVKIAKKEAE